VSETPIHNLLTVKETAEYLRIPLPTVYYLVQRGTIPAIQIGGRWRIKKSSLDRDILRQDKQGQPTVLVVDDDPGQNYRSPRVRSSICAPYGQLDLPAAIFGNREQSSDLRWLGSAY
jgi:excisionase family DNA binding protein